MLIDFLWKWGPWLYNKYFETVNLSSKIYTSIYKDLYCFDNWIFIHNIDIPISEELFDIREIDISNIKWIASTNPPIFKDPRYTDNSYQLKHISHLGFSIIISDNKIIDISDWINEIKWSGIIQPSTHDIFSLWCCKNRSPLLYYKNNITVEIITETGDIVKKGLNETTHTNKYENESHS